MIRNYMDYTNKTNNTHNDESTKRRTQHDIPIEAAKQQVLILQWNIYGLRGRKSDLDILIHEYQPMIITLQETMTNERSMIKYNMSKEYKWYYAHNSSNPNIHGVCIGVKQYVPHSKIDLKTTLQAIAIKCKYPTRATIVSIYIPPRKHNISEIDVKNELEELIKQI